MIQSETEQEKKWAEQVALWLAQRTSPIPVGRASAGQFGRRSQDHPLDVDKARGFFTDAARELFLKAPRRAADGVAEVEASNRDLQNAALNYGLEIQYERKSGKRIFRNAKLVFDWKHGNVWIEGINPKKDYRVLDLVREGRSVPRGRGMRNLPQQLDKPVRTTSVQEQTQAARLDPSAATLRKDKKERGGSKRQEPDDGK